MHTDTHTHTQKQQHDCVEFILLTVFTKLLRVVGCLRVMLSHIKCFINRPFSQQLLWYVIKGVNGWKPITRSWFCSIKCITASGDNCGLESPFGTNLPCNKRISLCYDQPPFHCPIANEFFFFLRKHCAQSQSQRSTTLFTPLWVSNQHIKKIWWITVNDYLSMIIRQ